MNSASSTCPLCKEPINAGALACKSCGATEISAWNNMGIWKSYVFALFWLPFIIGGMTWAFGATTFGPLVMLASAAGFFWLRSTKSKQRVWVTGASKRSFM